MELEFKKPFWYNNDSEFIYEFATSIEDIMGENIQAKIIEKGDQLLISPEVNPKAFKEAVHNGLKMIYYVSMWNFCDNCLKFFNKNLPVKYTPRKYWEVNDVIGEAIKNQYSAEQLMNLNINEELSKIIKKLISSINRFMIEHDAPERILINIENYEIDRLIRENWQN